MRARKLARAYLPPATSGEKKKSRKASKPFIIRLCYCVQLNCEGVFVSLNVGKHLLVFGAPITTTDSSVCCVYT